MIKWSTILISISAIAKAVCDILKLNDGGKLFKSDWWLAKGEFTWYNRNFLEKYFFSFISDGWHFFDMIRIMSVIILISLLMVKAYTYRKFDKDDYYINHNRWLAITLLILGFYIYHGIVFEIVYFILL